MTTSKFLSRITTPVMFNKGIADETKAEQRTLAEFRAHITDMTSPPGLKDTWLGEVILHAEDVRRPWHRSLGS